MTPAAKARTPAVRLQVALDTETLEEALTLARQLEPYADIIEAGTPLIKAEGIRAVTALKKAFPKKKVCADIKTSDAGYYEVRMAAKAGADIITVLADAHNETLEEALRAAQEFKVEIMADLIVSKRPVSRLADIIGIRHEKTGLHYVLVHSGFDRQRARKSPLTDLIMCSRLRDRPRMAVAGGLHLDTIKQVLEFPVDIVIVGGGICRSGKPVEAATAIRKAIQQKSTAEDES